MNGSQGKRNGARADFVRLAVGFTAALVGCLSTGCSGRVFTITQDDRINNAMHQHRPEKQRTGDPLEVTIVCVRKEDLKLKENERLKPGSGITSDEWYAHRPQKGPRDTQHFYLPPKQVHVLTNEPKAQVYGTVIGPALRGAINDGSREIVVRGVHFPSWQLHSPHSVVYVFPKFIGSDGKVLAVPPAEYQPPGAYSAKLSFKIGVEKGRGQCGQYIENTTPRRLHGSGKKK